MASFGLDMDMNHASRRRPGRGEGKCAGEVPSTNSGIDAHTLSLITSVPFIAWRTTSSGSVAGSYGVGRHGKRLPDASLSPGFHSWRKWCSWWFLSARADEPLTHAMPCANADATQSVSSDWRGGICGGRRRRRRWRLCCEWISI